MNLGYNIIRPIQPDDLDSLCQIADDSGPGFTSLPANRALLEKKIEASVTAFNSTTPDPLGSSYLFILEQGETGEVIGVCGIEAEVGLRQPFYHYRLGKVVHAYRELGIHNTFRTLYLCNDYTGCAELCSLFLQQDHRHHTNGALLSKSRFLFMAQAPSRFTTKVIAEMRGVSDSRNHSPFWDGLGQHFFSMPFSEADYLTGIGNKVFIAELMPKHSIYLHLLPDSAQQVIGEVHAHTVPARVMLEQEGFRYEEYIDIFDGGPTLACQLNDIRAVRDSLQLTVELGQPASQAEPWLLSNAQYLNFRCTVVNISPSAGQITLPVELAQRLQVAEGDTVRAVRLKP